LISGVAPTQVQDPAFAFGEPQGIHMGLLLQLVQIPLDGISPLRCVDCTTLHNKIKIN